MILSGKELYIVYGAEQIKDSYIRLYLDYTGDKFPFQGLLKLINQPSQQPTKLPYVGSI